MWHCWLGNGTSSLHSDIKNISNVSIITPTMNSQSTLLPKYLSLEILALRVSRFWSDRLSEISNDRTRILDYLVYSLATLHSFVSSDNCLSTMAFFDQILFQFPVTFLWTQIKVSLFQSWFLIMLVLIGMIFVIILKMLHGRTSLIWVF